MHLRKLPVSFVAFLFPFIVTHAYQHKTGFLGLAYVSENSLGKITKSDSGSTSLMGSTDIPLVARMDFTMTKDYFISPRLTYGLLGRKGSDSTTTVTNLHLFAPIGKNFSGAKYDWGIGPGILRRSLKGKGGTVQLSNGTGTSQFAVPGRDVVTQTITMNFGMSGNFGPVNAGADLITEGFASSTKRTFSLMLSLTAPLGGSRRSSR